jgi:hypothetical protein
MLICTSTSLNICEGKAFNFSLMFISYTLFPHLWPSSVAKVHASHREEAQQRFPTLDKEKKERCSFELEAIFFCP